MLLGIKDTKDISLPKIERGADDAGRFLDKSLPLNYLTVIEGYSDKEKKVKLKKVANNINLFLQTTFKDSGVSSQWMKFGKLPSHMKIANTKSIATMADKIIKLRKTIIADEDRIGKLSAADKLQKRQVDVLDNASARIALNKVELTKLEENFYFDLLDFESSLGGVY